MYILTDQDTVIEVVARQSSGRIVIPTNLLRGQPVYEAQIEGITYWKTKHFLVSSTDFELPVNTKTRPIRRVARRHRGQRMAYHFVTDAVLDGVAWLAIYRSPRGVLAAVHMYVYQMLNKPRTMWGALSDSQRPPTLQPHKNAGPPIAYTMDVEQSVLRSLTGADIETKVLGDFTENDTHFTMVQKTEPDGTMHWEISASGLVNKKVTFTSESFRSPRDRDQQQRSARHLLELWRDDAENAIDGRPR